jgi:hypothetical protein
MFPQFTIHINTLVHGIGLEHISTKDVWFRQQNLNDLLDKLLSLSNLVAEMLKGPGTNRTA